MESKSSSVSAGGVRLWERHSKPEDDQLAELTCSRCGNEGEQLPKAPISGELGQRVFDNICQNCWAEWKEMSMRIVNHYGLQPVDPDDRKKIYVFLREFFEFTD
jgi:Fe-S cluster biosynthesis and repair protein YggX